MSRLPARDERATQASSLAARVLLWAVALWMVQAHWQTVDIEHLDHKVRLHEQVLTGNAPDPYQYKLWLVTHALQAAADATGASLKIVFCANTLLALLALVWVHHLWLRSLFDPRTALFGTVLLGALSNALFLIYMHHPYEFWGLTGYCLLLRAVQRDVHWLALSALALATGLVWEKHALVPVLWGLYALQRGRPFVPQFLRGLVFFACALAVPVWVRCYLGGDRDHVDGMTGLDAQDWATVLWFQVAYLAPFVVLFFRVRRSLPPWVRWLWLYLPILLLAYTVQRYILHEARSFWALAPVFTATACTWWRVEVAPERTAS